VALIFSFELILYCIVCGAIYIALVDLLWNKLESVVPTFRNFPKELVETKNVNWFVSSLIIEFIFFVLMPAVVYDRFYTVLPFSGIRGGISIALFLFMFGMVPLAILLMFRIKLPAVYMLYILLGLLLKITGSLAIIGYLYSL